MPFPFSLLCLLPRGMLNIDAEQLTIVCLYSYLHFYFIVESFFYKWIIDLLCYYACMLSGIVFCLNNIFISVPFLLLR